MTGTADTEAVEFNKIYKLDVVVIPTNLPVARADEDDVVYSMKTRSGKPSAPRSRRPLSAANRCWWERCPSRNPRRCPPCLRVKALRHEVLNAKNHAREALIIAEPDPRARSLSRRTWPAAARTSSSGATPEYRARKRAGTSATPEQYDAAYKLEYEKVEGRLFRGEEPRRPVRDRHRAPRKPTDRQSAPRTVRPSGRSWPLQVFHLYG
jgi:preprotein translocase subunit SecA